MDQLNKLLTELTEGYLFVIWYDPQEKAALEYEMIRHLSGSPPDDMQAVEGMLVLSPRKDECLIRMGGIWLVPEVLDKLTEARDQLVFSTTSPNNIWSVLAVLSRFSVDFDVGT